MATVAIVGTRFPDFSIEEEVFSDDDVSIVSGEASTAEELLAVAGDADVILAGSAPRFPAEVIAKLSCRGLVRYGVGTEKIDLEAAAAAGIWVANVVDYGTEAVAQHTLALALAATRALGQADRLIRAGGWGIADIRPLRLPGSMRAGCVGYGRIGRRVSELLAAVGFQVSAYDPYSPPTGDGGVHAASLAELIAESDLLSLHLPGSPDGSPLLGADELAAMKPGSCLVNTARGSLIDLDALARSMRDQRPRWAALDVFPDEPLTGLPAALEQFADRLILTPHMAWYSEESEYSMRRQTAERALSILRGERPEDIVVDPTER